MTLRAIIPCAGFGTRMGMLPGQSKEMLWDKQREEYVIDYSLKLCKKVGIDPLVISRSEKKDLNSYLFDRGDFPVMIEDGTEWYDTILKSYEYWDENNVVILPDTRWDNAVQSLEHVKYCLEERNKPMCLGTLGVDDATKWCVLFDGKLHEKPKENITNIAIGIFAFKKHWGDSLFAHFEEKFSFRHATSTQFVKLENFHDITREKSDRLVYL